MILKKTTMLNNIVFDIIINSIKTTLFNVLINKVLPLVSNLFKFIGDYSYYYSYYSIFIYLIIAVLILFILYKLFKYFNTNIKKKSSSHLSSISSRSSDFDLNCQKMEKLKNKKKSSNTKSNKLLTTDLLSSFTH